MNKIYAFALMAVSVLGGTQELSAAKMTSDAPSSRAELTMADVCRYYMWGRYDMMTDLDR